MRSFFYYKPIAEQRRKFTVPGGRTVSLPEYQVRRAPLRVRVVWRLFRHRSYRRQAGALRVYRALAPICKPGVARATAAKYFREHTGREKGAEFEEEIHRAILDALTAGKSRSLNWRGMGTED